MHRPLDLRPIDVTRHREVPITNPMRSLLDAGASLDRAQVAECVEPASNAGWSRSRDCGSSSTTSAGAAALVPRPSVATSIGGRSATNGPSMLEPLMARLLLPVDLGIGPIEYQATLRLKEERSIPTSS